MELRKLRKQFKAITAELRVLVEKDELTDEENDLLLEKRKSLDLLKVKIDSVIEKDGPTKLRAAGDLIAAPLNGVTIEASAGAAREDRSYSGMFPAVELEKNEWGGISEFAFKVGHRLPDDRMQRSLTEGLGSTGGYAVPTQYASEIFNVALQAEIVRPRATVYSIGAANKLKIPGTVIGDHSSNLFGGVTCAWAGEEESLSDANPELRDVELTPYKLTSLYKASNEWFADATAADKMVNATMGGAIGWNLDRAFIRGSGAGQPLGILNADCTLEISKEDGQTADTVVSENVFKMVAGMHPACFSRSVWVVHPDVLAKLFSLAVVVGTGGSAIFVPAGGAAPFNTLLGRPVLVSEHCSPLGDAGDIMLCDFSQYAIGMRKELSIDASAHVHFTSDQLAFRGIMRVDGQPLWDEKLTLADGAKEVSPFVIIEDRA